MFYVSSSNYSPNGNYYIFYDYEDSGGTPKKILNFRSNFLVYTTNKIHPRIQWN